MPFDPNELVEETSTEQEPVVSFDPNELTEDIPDKRVDTFVKKPSVMGIAAEETGKMLTGVAESVAEGFTGLPGFAERIGRTLVGAAKAPASVKGPGGMDIKSLGDIYAKADQESVLPVSIDPVAAGARSLFSGNYKEELAAQKEHSESLPFSSKVVGAVLPLATGAPGVASKIATKFPKSAPLIEKLSQTISEFVASRGGKLTEQVAAEAAKEGFKIEATTQGLKTAVVEDQALKKAGQTGITRDREQAVKDIIKERSGYDPNVPEIQRPTEVMKGPDVEQIKAQTIAEMRQQGLGTGAGPVEKLQVPEQATFGGAPTVSKVGNVNLDNINTPDELRGAFQQQAEANRDVFNAAKRGSLTAEEVQKNAKELGITIDNIKARKLGGVYTPEEIEVGKIAIKNSMAETFNIARNGTREEFIKSALKTEALSSNFFGGKSEVARALALSKEKDFGALVNRKVFKEIFGAIESEKDWDRAHELLKRIPQDDPQAMLKFYQDMKSTTWKGKLYELYVNGLMSKPTSIVRNNLGNTMISLSRGLETVAAGPIDMARAAISKTPRERYTSEILPMASSLLSGFKKGGQAFVQAMATGMPQSTRLTDIRVPQIKGKLGTIVRLPGTIQGASDDLFKAVHSQASIYANAYRVAKQEKLAGKAMLDRMATLISNPTKEILDTAKADSLYWTFNQELGPTMKRFQAIQQTPGGKVLMPFFRIGVNTNKMGLERSPLGFVRVAYRALSGDPLKGGELTDALTRAALGTGLYIGAGAGGVKALKEIKRGAEKRPAMQPTKEMTALQAVGSLVSGGIAQLWAEGKITGAVPKDPQKAKVFYDSKRLPYAFKVGDKWVQYSLDPLMTPIGILADTLDNWDQLDTEHSALALSTVVATNFLERQFMMGLNNAMNAIEDPLRSGDKFIGQMAASMLPASGLVRGIAQADYPYVTKPKGIGQSLENAIPGLRKNVPLQYSFYGEPAIIEGGKMKILFSPFRESTESTDKAIEEVARLGVKPGIVKEEIGNYNMNDQIYQDYQIKRGEWAHKIHLDYVNRKEYADLPDVIKAEKLQKGFELARDRAKKELKIKPAELIKKVDRAQKIGEQLESQPILDRAQEKRSLIEGLGILEPRE